MGRAFLLLLAVAALASGAAIVGCALSLDGYEGPTASDGDSSPEASSLIGAEAGDASDADAVSDAAIDADAGNGCGGNPGVGAPMLRVLDAGFCIDTTEVTLDQYATFYAANPEPPSPCGWKTDYTAPAFKGNAAIGDVDWCDAYSYCKWAGKRLCGGMGGVQLNLTNSISPTSEWQFACTHGGDPNFQYPYGKTVNPQICLYSDSPNSGHARDVASNPACVGPVGIFDMSGNVWEWENACDRSLLDTDPTAQCNLRGGGFLRDSADWGACAVVPSGWDRNSRVADTGIRCCSDYAGP